MRRPVSGIAVSAALDDPLPGTQGGEQGQEGRKRNMPSLAGTLLPCSRLDMARRPRFLPLEERGAPHDACGLNPRSRTGRDLPPDSSAPICAQIAS